MLQRKLFGGLILKWPQFLNCIFFRKLTNTIEFLAKFWIKKVQLVIWLNCLFNYNFLHFVIDDRHSWQLKWMLRTINFEPKKIEAKLHLIFFFSWRKPNVHWHCDSVSYNHYQAPAPAPPSPWAKIVQLSSLVGCVT